MLKPKEAVALWGISADSAADSKEFSNRVNRDGKGGLTMPLLSDPKREAIDGYGLQDARYARQSRDSIPYPATYVIDKSGRVAWMRIDRDHTVRPPNSEIRAALDALR